MDNQNQPIAQNGITSQPATWPTKIDLVRATFMLNLENAAKVFHVSQQDLINLMYQDDAESMWPTKALQRLEILVELSKSWRCMERLAGRWTTFELSTGRTLIELLCEETIDPPEILNAHAELVAAIPALLKAEHDRSLAVAIALKPAFEKLARLNNQSL